MNPKEIIIRFVKGFVIGSSMLIPGVSGGTMAIILNIYSQLINAVSRIRQDIRGNTLLLFNYAIGGLAGILVLSEPLLYIVEKWPMPSLYFFMGCILASIYPLYKVGTADRIKIKNIFVVVIGLGIGISLKFLPEGIFDAGQNMSVKMFAFLIIAGFIIAVALILPGISGSYMLLVFGMYNVTLKAIREIDLLYLFPLVIGLVIGTFGTAKAIDNLMTKHPQFIIMLIIGFMFGSLYELFPGIPFGSDISLSLVSMLSGFTVIFLIVSRGIKKKTEKSEEKIHKKSEECQS